MDEKKPSSSRGSAELSVKSWASALLAAFLVSIFVLGLRAAGGLEFLELAFYDAQLRLNASDTPKEDRVVLVTMSDDDIAWLGRWPMSDRSLQTLVVRILEGRPSVIGLDIYRNIPIAPGSAELKEFFNTQRLPVITVRKIGSESTPGVDPPFFLDDYSLTAFSDLPLDSGDVIRRGLLFMDDGEQVYYSLSLLLALSYLSRVDIAPEPGEGNPEHLKLGKTTFEPFEPDIGGYAGADARGYQFLLDYGGINYPLNSISVKDVLSGNAPEGFFRDKIVLVGVTAESVKDFVTTPFSGYMRKGSSAQKGAYGSQGAVFGVQLHGLITGQILRHAIKGERPMSSPSKAAEGAYIIMWALLGGALGLFSSSVWRFFFFSLTGALGLTALTLWAFSHGQWLPAVPPLITFTSSAAFVTALSVHRENVERRFLMSMFSKHVSKDVAEDIWRQREIFTARGRPLPRKQTATVLFSDMEGFTTLSEKMSPDVLMDWLNEYMEAMWRVINDRGGVLNKYIGDSVMAIFGAPSPRLSPDEIRRDAINSVECALDMSRELKSLNTIWADKGLPGVSIRIGVCTGELVSGSLGSTERMEYTVVGDTVNVASRLESYLKEELDIGPSGCRILISETTRELLPGEFIMERVGQVRLKGKDQSITAYRVRGKTEGKA